MRERLTKRVAEIRNRKAVDIKDGLFPGDVGNPERAKNYKKMDQYHSFEHTLNHEIPDMRHEWKENPREESGHGIPRMAKVYIAAKKATKLAMMLLGDDANEKTLELQARDFMRMGGKALSASINRWAEIQEEEIDENVDEIVDVEDETEEPTEEKEACNETKTSEETKEDDKEVVAEEEDVVEDEAIIDVDDSLISTDIDFGDIEEDEVEADKELEGLFEGADEGDDNDVAPVGENLTASKKTGIKRLAGQPKLCRVASRKDADSLEGLWSKWESPNIR